MEELHPIVIELGSGWIKAGFAGDAAPQVVFPTVVGRPRHDGLKTGMGRKAVSIGDEALSKRGVLTLTYPIERNNIIDSGALENILHHSFAQLGVEPEEHPVLVIVPVQMSKAQLERLTQMLMESFNLPALAIASRAVAALAATGRQTGIVLGSGYGTTFVVPIADGHSVIECSQLMDAAGNELTDYLRQLLEAKGYALTTTAEHAMVNDMKATHCAVALEFAAELANAATATYELPNGTRVLLGAERLRCPEALFQPALIKMEADGIHRMLYQSIMQCAVKLRAALFANIVLAGGTTLLPGLAARLKKELTALAPAGTKIEIIAPPARNYLAWTGGARMATSATWQANWISKQEFANLGGSGPAIVHRKLII